MGRTSVEEKIIKAKAKLAAATERNRELEEERQAAMVTFLIGNRMSFAVTSSLLLSGHYCQYIYSLDGIFVENPAARALRIRNGERYRIANGVSVLPPSRQSHQVQPKLWAKLTSSEPSVPQVGKRGSTGNTASLP
jgi:hypothetical protein